jgi:hypothetical protein
VPTLVIVSVEGLSLSPTVGKCNPKLGGIEVAAPILCDSKISSVSEFRGSEQMYSTRKDIGKPCTQEQRTE